MIDFQPIHLEDRGRYLPYLQAQTDRGCEYSFANLYLWGRQQAAVVEDHMVIFSQHNRRSVYPFPVGTGDKKAVLNAIMEDAAQRGIPCRITGLTEEDALLVENLYPGRFRRHCDRDSYDYVYDIQDLAELKGKKYQKKRNHIHRFCDRFPNYRAEVLTPELLPAVEQMLHRWYEEKEKAEPGMDLHMEKAALSKALRHRDVLEMEGMVLLDDDRVLAVTLASFLNEHTMDVHFEKALGEAEGAYPAINRDFARYLRDKYPQLQYLNREDDMGLEGLRKAKLSYYPHHMVEKCWVCLLEDGYDY